VPQKTTIIAIATALAATMLLAGCTASDGSPEPTQRPDASTPAAAPVGTATPAPPAGRESQIRAAITQIIVRPELLQLKDKEGALLGSISYDATAEVFVDLFTELMGAAPTVTDTPGGIEALPVTHYSWSGFELQDDHEPGDYEADMNVSVTFTAAELGPRRITVSTIQGFKPGDDLRWLANYMDEPFYEESEFNQIQAEHGPPIGEQAQYNAYSNSNSVTGQNLYKHDGSVIFAPWNFGIGHV
jgi:hypothetical protein